MPKYRDLARHLEQSIASGEVAPGAKLLGELQLMRRHGVSRHTVREALRLLEDQGLVQRRRGSGARVLAARAPSVFVQALDDDLGLLQYAREARLQVLSMRRRTLSRADRRRLDLDEAPAGLWLVIEGARRAGGPPVAATTLYIAPPYAAAGERIEAWEGSVRELLGEMFGVQVDEIGQSIAADAADARLAERLAIERGAPVLITRRLYRDGAGALVLGSFSAHAASRFEYRMTYRPGP